MTDRASAEGLRGWTVNEGKDDDGSYFIESKVMPGCVVGADTRDEAWSQWPEVVELWASTANENRVKAERDLPALRSSESDRERDKAIVMDILEDALDGYGDPSKWADIIVDALSTPRTETSDHD